MTGNVTSQTLEETDMTNESTTTDSTPEPGVNVTIDGKSYVIVPEALFKKLLSWALAWVRESRERRPNEDEIPIPPNVGDGGEGFTIGGREYVIQSKGSAL